MVQHSQSTLAGDQSGSRQTRGLSGFQLRVIGLCVLINMQDGFDILAISYAAPAIAADWQLGNASLGLLFSMGLFGMMLGSLLLGPLCDRIGRRPVLLGGLATSAVAMVGAAVSESLPLLLVSRALTGLSIGALLPAINTLVAEYAPPRSRTLCVAVLQAGFPIGAALGGLGAALLLQYYSWPAIFLLGAALSVIMLALAWWGVPESRGYLASRGAQPHKAAVGEPASYDPGKAQDNLRLSDHVLPLALLAGSFLMALLAFYVIVSWTPKLLVESGLSLTQGISGGAILTSGGLVAALLVGLLSFRLPLSWVVSAAMVLTVVASVAFGLVTAAPEPSITVILMVAFVLGVAANASVIGLYALTPGLFPTLLRASGTGLALGLGRIGSAIGPALVGLMLAGGLVASDLYLLLAIPYGIGAVLVFALRRFHLY